MHNNQQVQSLSIGRLFSDGSRYIVPMYQRNYEWGKDEIEQLLNDIKNAQNTNLQKNYYIGSLVVARRNNGDLEVIDGQQRLTTLSILQKVINQNAPACLSYEHRLEADRALSGEAKNADTAIIRGRNIIERYWQGLSHDVQQKWAEFLNDKVIILRTEVPENTDLNHYFEIMNTRGEQLEKHEVLKARLMACLPRGQDQAVFAAIWDACSDMSRFAVMGFEKRAREALFGQNWVDIPEEFGVITKCFKQMPSENTEAKSILNLLEGADLSVEQDEQEGERDGNFAAVIDFPNFLMQVLKVENANVRLDEKFLLEEFERYLLHDNKDTKIQKNIKDFTISLLKIRLLFDRYILRTDGRQDDGRWAILTMKNGENNAYPVNTFDVNRNEQEADDGSESRTAREIKMLQAMFHVSHTARNYKNWLQAGLVYLYHKKQIKAIAYLKFWQKLAKDFYQEQKQERGTPWCYQNTPYYVFNYLDYLIWCAYQDGGLDRISPQQKETKYERELKRGLKEFEFFNRSSVEHYYPQHPKDGAVWQTELDGLGNLCLIGHSQNSSLSNSGIEDKRRHVLSRLSKGYTAESCKQLLMMMYPEWTPKTAAGHRELMEGLLK